MDVCSTSQPAQHTEQHSLGICCKGSIDQLLGDAMVLDVEEPCARAGTAISQTGYIRAGNGHSKGPFSVSQRHCPWLGPLRLRPKRGGAFRQRSSTVCNKPLSSAAFMSSSVISALRCWKSLRSTTGGMLGIAETAIMAVLGCRSTLLHVNDKILNLHHSFSAVWIWAKGSFQNLKPSCAGRPQMIRIRQLATHT